MSRLHQFYLTCIENMKDSFIESKKFAKQHEYIYIDPRLFSTIQKSVR
jgi:hypothetical protein